jgi:hypothetical protein
MQPTVKKLDCRLRFRAPLQGSVTAPVIGISGPHLLKSTVNSAVLDPIQLLAT